MRNQHYAEMQEKMFQQAKEEMEDKLNEQASRKGSMPFNGYYSSQFGAGNQANIDMAAYYQTLEKQINE